MGNPITYNENRKYLSTSFLINRFDWNIGKGGSWLEKKLVDKEVYLTIEICTDWAETSHGMTKLLLYANHQDKLGSFSKKTAQVTSAPDSGSSATSKITLYPVKWIEKGAYLTFLLPQQIDLTKPVFKCFVTTGHPHVHILTVYPHNHPVQVHSIG